MTESEPALNGFFLAQQLAIDAARVDRDAKTLCDSFGQMSTGDVRIGRAELRNEIHQFRRQFVPGSRPAFLWQQTGESGFSKSCLCLIERRSREAECFGGLTDWLVFDIDQPKHLVFDLQQVLPVEELALVEALVNDVFRTRVQRPLTPQERSFVLLRIGHML